MLTTTKPAKTVPAAARLKTGGMDAALLLAAGIMTAIPLAYFIWKVTSFTGGPFVYPLDDTYIHMELARNLAAHGNWGINSEGFGSASSSVLYTLLLAGFFKVWGAHEWIPLVVNCLAACGLLFSVQRWMRRQGLPPAGQLLLFAAAVFLTPLPVIIMSGMEHVLQCWFSFLFITHFAAWLHGDRAPLPAALVYYGILVAATRYEGLFLLAVAFVIACLQGRWKPALLLGILSSLPLLVFGWYALRQGAYFLPNSVLVKSSAPGLSLRGLAGYIGNILVDRLTVAKGGITALATQRLLLLLPLVFILFRPFFGERPYLRTITWLLLGTTVLQLALASTGWFYRYEAYLVLGAVIFAGTLCLLHGRALWEGSIKRLWFPVMLIVCFLMAPFFLRSMAGFTKAVRASINIYEQQYQMARFLGTYYPRAAFAANDIGAVSFFTQGRVFDLWGLGHNEVARSRKRGYWTPAYLDSLARREGAAIAIIYDDWFDPALPRHWQFAASWSVRDNVILGGDRVSFYAIEPAAAARLRANLVDFQKRLPPGVTVRYEPLNGAHE